MPLTRLEFVALAAEAIASTRDKVKIGNQLSGYIQFHKEIKSKYIKKARAHLKEIALTDFMQIHDFIEHTGIGHCYELAYHLLVELGKRVDDHKEFAKIAVIKSAQADHVYLDVRIRLKDEKFISVWEIDAWDPRVIDISTRPDETIKNLEALDYGYYGKPYSSTFTDKIDYNQHFKFKNTPKVQEGQPEGDCTPVRAMLDKHENLYRDYTLKKAVEAEKVPIPGTLHFLQKASIWQKEPVKTKSQLEDHHCSKKMKLPFK